MPRNIRDRHVRSKGGTFFIAVAAAVIGIAGVVLTLVY
jgi:hypothetical protein